ncbi:hypothetical protein CU044_7096 [Streptomyces sp. L-9-10]|nr:hypothetical protein CU044_7096 [Streptomyces sp. L-9-10]
MQRSVAAASLQQPEQGAARRYDWIEHGESLTSSCRRNRGCDRGTWHPSRSRPRGNMIGRPSSSA